MYQFPAQKILAILEVVYRLQSSPIHRIIPNAWVEDLAPHALSGAHADFDADPWTDQHGGAGWQVRARCSKPNAVWKCLETVRKPR